MSPEVMQGLFKPFYQAVDLRLKTEGTGLGLAISQNLVKLMGSKIVVESQKGKGSKFGFEIHLKNIKHAKTEKIQNLSNGIVVSYNWRNPKLLERRKSLSILIVDDSQVNRHLLKSIWSNVEIQIREAKNGKIGLELIYEEKPDIVLLDLMMPEMDGFEMMKLLRTKPDYDDVRVIAISANVLKQAREESLSLGCDAFISKPFKIQDLLDMIKEIMDLEWVYAGKEESKSKNHNVADDKKKFTLPPEEDISVIRHMVRQHNITGLEDFIKELKRRAEKSQESFIEEIESLTSNLDFDAILKLIGK